MTVAVTPALAEALRAHEEACRQAGRSDLFAEMIDEPTRDDRRVEATRAALLAAMAPPVVAGLDLGEIGRDQRAATVELGPISADGPRYLLADRDAARGRCADRHVPALLAALRAAQPDREALLRAALLAAMAPPVVARLDLVAIERACLAAKKIDPDECHRIADRLEGSPAEDYPCVTDAMGLLRFIAERADSFRVRQFDVPSLLAALRAALLLATEVQS